MLSQERYDIILNLLKNKEIVKMKEIVDTLNISESTIRRDLSYLEKNGLLKRVHGGATLPENSYEADFDTKNIQNKFEKDKIGESASKIVLDGECIFIDAGTTTERIIKYLHGKNVTVVTNGVTHIPELMKYNIRAYLTGGKIKNNTGALVGVETVESLRKYNFNKCFIGVNGITLKTGYTTPDIEEAEIKREVIKQSQKSYILADFNKFGKTSFVSFAQLKECTIITDKLPPEEYRKKTKIKEC
ncbi:DeoR/GlpR family DNA-binding transcription regulator [Ilyobacter polytropus]|uniref:Transcriptional regulator, DeoR family n=1 Tax=Ilyobacter polytropus (strain ATCC 51220 / DSM 2926 / LMG 16218 / CuHBu1) TaxID=572544 RepID=E3H708_ILYPC|nr:DeoR/GlpR family DNA-binding transcription regulator [Ilyobacter polytropus]ADO82527.1 transcriptional regulator, DeoR family [Ilyobacter polytropus DSM 2926]